MLGLQLREGYKGYKLGETLEMAKGKKKKTKASPDGGSRERKGRQTKDPALDRLLAAEADGDNRCVLSLARSILNETEASLEAKEAALLLKKRLAYDPVALLFAGGGVVLWVILLIVFVLGRG